MYVEWDDFNILLKCSFKFLIKVIFFIFLDILDYIKNIRIIFN